MESVRVEYTFEDIGNARHLCARVLDETWHSVRQATLLGEVCESLAKSSYENLCLDLTSLRIVNSSVFGVLMNLANICQDHRKRLRLRLDSAAAETASVAHLDRIALIETPEGA